MKQFTVKLSLVFAMFFALSTNSLKAQTNQYLDFDGVDDFVSVTNGSAAIAGSNAFTLTGWFYDNALSYGQGLMGYRGTNAGFWMIELNNGSIECRFINSAGTLYQVVAPNYTIVPQTWQHYAWVYGGNTVKLYLNGTLVGSAAAAGLIASTTTTFAIGKSILSGFNFNYNGHIDEVSVWNKALSQTEIQNMMTNELVGNEPNLKMYFKMNQGVPGGNNTGITSLHTEVNSPLYDGVFNNFALNGATSNFNGTLNVNFQAILFPPISTQLISSPPYVLNATATSGLPVSYTLLSGPATLNGDTLNFTGAGTVTVIASQLGNAVYDSATSVVNTFDVVDPAQNLAIIEPRNPLPATNVYMHSLSAIELAAIAKIQYPALFSLTGLQFVINGITYPATDYANGHYTAWWTPPAYGPYTVQIVSTSNFGFANTVNVNINVVSTIANIDSVPAFSGIWLDSSTPSATADASLPSYVDAFDTIIATLTVTCPPSGGCGAWDRVASIDAMGPDGKWFEVIRYITPYATVCSHKINLADYMSLLQGKVTFRMNCATLDNGYVYALRFDFKEGSPLHKYSKVEQVWKDIYPFGQYGNLQPVPNFIHTYEPTAVASKLKLVSTGHSGPNNTSNAAEFYDATHHVLVNGATTFTQHNWTTCNPNPDACSPQAGTWTYSRAGWCPGSIAKPFDFDMSSFVTTPNVDLQYVFYPTYVDHCSAFYPGCVTNGSCDCADGLNPNLNVNCNLVTFYDNAASLAVHEIEKTDLIVYPNPSKGMFTLSAVGRSGKSYAVAVYDVLGNRLKQFNWNGDRTIIDLTNSPKGVYFVKISNDKSTEVKKLMVQ